MARGRFKVAAVLAALCAVAVVAVVAAWPSGKPVAPDTIAQEATTTGSAKEAAVAMKVTVNPGPLGRDISFTGEGYENLKRQEGRFTFDMSSLAELFGGRFEPDDLEMEAIFIEQ